ncbi:MAG: hypothetical protein JO272_05950 [Pseudonocardiales bacterium]|nr:hypothetical protein [Pseudonocardiales bacterium]
MNCGQYSAAHLDHDLLIRHAERVIPAVGRASRGYPTYATGVELAKLLKRPVLQLPGGHVGYATEPADFAAELLPALAGNDTPTPR